jgi:hypothetical protein
MAAAAGHQSLWDKGGRKSARHVVEASLKPHSSSRTLPHQEYRTVAQMFQFEPKPLLAYFGLLFYIRFC